MDSIFTDAKCISLPLIIGIIGIIEYVQFYLPTTLRLRMRQRLVTRMRRLTSSRQTLRMTSSQVTVLRTRYSASVSSSGW